MVVKKEVLQKATRTLELSLLGRVIKKIDVKEDVAVIAVVGSGMRGIKGVRHKQSVWCCWHQEYQCNHDYSRIFRIESCFRSE